MISRCDLLKVERAVFRLIGICASVREGNTEDSEAFQLVVELEHECHGMVKRIGELTEGAMKYPHGVNEKREGA